MKNRILKTFSGYIVLLLVPVSILFYQGTVSLKNHKLQLENSLNAQHDRVANDFIRDLSMEWQRFLEREKVRPFTYYLPVIFSEGDQIATTGGDLVYQRSPLYLNKVRQLKNLRPTESGIVDGMDQTTESLYNIIENSVVGYFQLDPATRRVTTPYDTNEAFKTSRENKVMVDQFRQFLEQEIKPLLITRLGVDNIDSMDKSVILRNLKASRRLNKSKESLSELQTLFEFATQNPSYLDEKGEDWVSISYYDFASIIFPDTLGNKYIVSFRIVLVDEHLLIQGFLINLLIFHQGSQSSYLEHRQPEFGSVVIRETTAVAGGVKLIEPFGNLTLQKRKNDQAAYLQSYYEERNRFWFSIFCLILVLGASMFHMGKLISAQAFLTRKKNDFISAITHELKAPLTSIIMYTEMLLEGWAKGKEHTYYKYIHCESERLSRLIKNVLDYSGIERGVFRAKKNSLLLDEFIEETLEPLQVWIENNGLKYSYQVRSTPYVRFDKDSLAQVIYNLCDNAIKYARTDPNPLLTIIIDETDTDAILIVFDNGPGVPKEDETKVFNRFHRCENELTRESTGTGLGLSLVKELVESNGGTINLFHPETGSGFGVKILIPKSVDSSLETAAG
ncbi:HAMP domain-containing histidine kinase [Sulfidibacter corallicola]|uniref:histidine kinase n=1 Tax=Sulfidibacter corallicola TaxID=2818388 RepID=A0A8A4TTL0_SULCO|nr:HAMP domain-containing sensor histidine kinase [Sulfidibacter corallicola]QTD53306.1 HAMP domain-containing histidine kinase [Sulfidibacter corallicola]